MAERHGTPDVVVVIGLGLIGASLAASVRANGAAREVRGYDADATTRERALARGLVDATPATLAQALDGASVIVIAVPTLAVESVLAAVRDSAPANAVITDVASVKSSVLEAARKIFGELPSGLVPGHPIAGSERSGVGAADPHLFRDHRVILTPHESSAADAVTCVRNMWEQAGASVVCMDAAEHDRVLALTSHLPHVLAFTLVNTLARQDASEQIFGFAAGGFRDFTRIASSDPVMWRDIAIANRAALLDALDVFSHGMTELCAAIDAADGDALHAAFTAARAARERYLGMLAAGVHRPSSLNGERT